MEELVGTPVFDNEATKLLFIVLGIAKSPVGVKPFAEYGELITPDAVVGIVCSTAYATWGLRLS